MMDEKDALSSDVAQDSPVTTTHETLLGVIYDTWQQAENDNLEYIQTEVWPLNALRAVVELHKPINYTKEAYPNRTDLPDVFFCSACTIAGVSSYPCPTIQAIEKELQ